MSAWSCATLLSTVFHDVRRKPSSEPSGPAGFIAFGAGWYVTEL